MSRRQILLLILDGEIWRQFGDRNLATIPYFISIICLSLSIFTSDLYTYALANFFIT